MVTKCCDGMGSYDYVTEPIWIDKVIETVPLRDNGDKPDKRGDENPDRVEHCPKPTTTDGAFGTGEGAH